VLCTSNFVDFVMFSYNAKIKDDTHVSSSLPNGCTGDEVCRIRLHIVSGRNVLFQTSWSKGSRLDGTSATVGIISPSKMFKALGPLNDIISYRLSHLNLVTHNSILGTLEGGNS